MAKYLDLKLGKKLKIYRFNTGVGQNGSWAFFSYTPYEKNPDGSTTYGQEYTIVISNIDDVQFELKDGVSVEIEKINSVTADFQSYTDKKTKQKVNKTVIKVAVDIKESDAVFTVPNRNPNVFTPNANKPMNQPNNQVTQNQFDGNGEDGEDEFPFENDYAMPNF